MSSLIVSSSITTNTKESVSLTQALLNLGANKKHVGYILERVKSTKEPIDVAAMDMGLISPEVMAQALAKVNGFGYFSSANAELINVVNLNEFIEAKLPGFKIERFDGYIPVGVNNDKLIIAVSSVEQINVANGQFYDFKNEFIFASSQTIQKVYKLYFSDTRSAFFDSLAKVQASNAEGDGILEEFYCNLLKHGAYYGANDIKMWRSKKAGMIAFKKEGKGELLCSISVENYSSILELLKSKTPNSDQLKYSPAETRIGSEWFSLPFQKKYAEIWDRYVFRVQLYMKPDNEWISTVIRINDSQSQVTDFSSLDFDEESKETLRRFVKAPTGLILVTGPTGSGKTSVLYSMLREIDPLERSVSTVENPIEYQNGMWNQKLMSKSQGRSESEMATIMLNSLLREAPDVILFGELRRDLELLDTVIDASNTGHLVFSTMHTQNAATTILRLINIGADPKTIASSLMGILAVRLIGILCPNCKLPDERESTHSMIKDVDGYSSDKKIYRSVGCDYCGGRGYKGRKMVYEILNCGRVQGLIEQGAKSIREIERVGLVNNKTMWDRALGMIIKGETSADEAEERIINPELAK